MLQAISSRQFASGQQSADQIGHSLAAKHKGFTVTAGEFDRDEFIFQTVQDLSEMIQVLDRYSLLKEPGSPTLQVI